MTVPRSTRIFLFLAYALGGMLLHGQEPATPADPKPKPAAEKPADKPADKTKRPKASDDDDRPAKPAPRMVRVASTPMPIATPIPRKPGFFQRLFRPKATPMPTRVVTVRTRPKPTPKPDDDDPATKGRKPPEKTPGVTGIKKPDPDDSDEPPPKKGSSTLGQRSKHTPVGENPEKEERALAEARKGGNPDTIETAQYNYARARANRDEQVRELKDKAENAPTVEEGQKALLEYNHALYDKMRKLEPDISERIDQMEAAMKRRIGGGN